MKISTKRNLGIAACLIVITIVVMYSYCGGRSFCYSFPFFNHVGSNQLVVTSLIVDPAEEEHKGGSTSLGRKGTLHFYIKHDPSFGKEHTSDTKPDKFDDDSGWDPPRTRTHRLRPPSDITGKVAEEILRRANVSEEEANKELIRVEKVDEKVDREIPKTNTSFKSSKKGLVVSKNKGYPRKINFPWHMTLSKNKQVVDGRWFWSNKKGRKSENTTRGKQTGESRGIYRINTIEVPRRRYKSQSRNYDNTHSTHTSNGTHQHVHQSAKRKVPVKAPKVRLDGTNEESSSWLQEESGETEPSGNGHTKEFHTKGGSSIKSGNSTTSRSLSINQQSAALKNNSTRGGAADEVSFHHLLAYISNLEKHRTQSNLDKAVHKDETDLYDQLVSLRDSYKRGSFNLTKALSELVGNNTRVGFVDNTRERLRNAGLVLKRRDFVGSDRELIRTKREPGYLDNATGEKTLELRRRSSEKELIRVKRISEEQDDDDAGSTTKMHKRSSLPDSTKRSNTSQYNMPSEQGNNNNVSYGSGTAMVYGNVVQGSPSPDSSKRVHTNTLIHGFHNNTSSHRQANVGRNRTTAKAHRGMTRRKLSPSITVFTKISNTSKYIDGDAPSHQQKLDGAKSMRDGMNSANNNKRNTTKLSETGAMTAQENTGVVMKVVSNSVGKVITAQLESPVAQRNERDLVRDKRFDVDD
ncbi:predicted protein [Nematostella vectensis]|uniref:Uncharacterized protein n=1 Tax=Nematostella vectensis TaxID=45351 RepID=A7S0J4_NEMVE|nr:uncharacterized protein LOC5514571 [Nematostella vectensis]EDO42687.1 predicted protein [Nematostella vectensis]|eukprot:XP_001634750.1 predicted protein [Nematostella vectensis]